MKERPEVTRDGNSRVARLNTSPPPCFYLTHQVRLYRVAARIIISQLERTGSTARSSTERSSSTIRPTYSWCSSTLRDVAVTGVQVQPDLQHVPPNGELHGAGADTHLHREGQEETRQKVRQQNEKQKSKTQQQKTKNKKRHTKTATIYNTKLY